MKKTCRHENQHRLKVDEAHILTKSYEENPACRRVEHLKNVIFDDGLRGARVPHLSQTFGESEGPPSGTLVGGVFFETSKFAVSSCNFCTLTELAPLAIFFDILSEHSELLTTTHQILLKLHVRSANAQNFCAMFSAIAMSSLSFWIFQVVARSNVLQILASKGGGRDVH